MFEKGRRRRPIFAVLEIEDHLRPIMNEITMWRSVIDQVFADAFSHPDTEQGEAVRQEALDWFAPSNAEDFTDICFLADVSESTVHRLFNHFMEARNGEDSA